MPFTSDADVGLDVWPGVVVGELEIFVLEVEDGLHVGINQHMRQRTRRAGELQTCLFEMVEVEVRVARGVNEVTRLQSCDLRHHLKQQGIAGNVERHAKERVSAALIELQREAAIGDVELEDGVARRKRHAVHLGHIPRRDNHASRVRIVFQLLHHLADLVDGTALLVGPCTPLVSVDGSKLAILVGPLVPNGDAMLLQPTDVGVATKEPQQLVDDGLEVEFLGGE